MNEMVERMAMAIWDDEQGQDYAPVISNRIMFGEDGPISWDRLNRDDVVPVIAERYRIKARKYIEAIREPTEAMLFVGSNDAAGFTADNLRECWHLMIDEALK